jgi:hypothetical protein
LDYGGPLFRFYFPLFAFFWQGVTHKSDVLLPNYEIGFIGGIAVSLCLPWEKDTDWDIVFKP